MGDLAIRAAGLSKRYRIGAAQGRFQYKTLRDTLVESFAAPFRRAGRLLTGRASSAADLHETIWALKDVSLEIKKGESVGIIGRNGAGKSTLLKVLSRITEPTEGVVEIHGRMGSLLEVGTGFHPELTGRENISLNGAILGMKRAEIARKFDAIVDFAEIEKFIDTPVKYYSSGMYVRLAFAVAAHLEPKILLVDEVLAVGDAAFQKKCLGKMGDVAGEGRTVLFVSHNMAAIQALCQRALLLERGRLVKDSGTDEVIATYLQGVRQRAEQSVAERRDRRGSGPIRYTGVTLKTDQREPMDSWPCGMPGYVILHYESGQDTGVLRNAQLGFSVNGPQGEPLFQCWTGLVPDWPATVPAKGAVQCFLPSLDIKPGLYTLNLYAEVGGNTSDWVTDAVQLVVVESDFFGSGKLPQHGSYFLVPQVWTVNGDERAAEAAPVSR